MSDNNAYVKEDDRNGFSMKVPQQMEQQQKDDDVDQVTRVIGAGGHWQNRHFLIISMVGIFASWHMMVISFYAPGADHWCQPPDHPYYNNWTIETWKNYAIPPDEKKPEKLSSCEMYDREYPPTDDVGTEQGNTTYCKYGWDYDRSQFTHTLENEYDLVCRRKALAKTGAATFNLGKLAGVVVLGHLSDRIGRKNTLLVSAALVFFGGIVTAFMPLLALFFVTRFFVAMGCSGLFTTGFVAVMETVDGKWRTIMGIGMEFPWCIGYMIVAGIAYAIPDWQQLQLVISVPVLVLALYYWFVPESIRWLISKGRIEEAEQIAEAAVKENKRSNEVKFSMSNDEENSGGRKYSMMDLFKTPVMRYRTFNFSFNWFVNSFVYYGLSLGTGDLGANKYITFFISGAVEVPAYLFSLWVLIAHGRRLPLCLTMVIGGAACMSTAIFTRGAYAYDWPIVTLAMIGKLCISASFAIVYVFTAEINPTVVRNIGMGTSSMCARIGSILAPYVSLLHDVHPAIPLVIFGLVSVAAGLLILLEPETNNIPLPETIEQAENFRRKGGICSAQ